METVRASVVVIESGNHGQNVLSFLKACIFTPKRNQLSGAKSRIRGYDKVLNNF